MPKRFPLPYNIGTDICHIPRIVNILKTRSAGTTTYGERFIKKVLRVEEREGEQDRLKGFAKWAMALRDVERRRDSIESRLQRLSRVEQKLVENRLSEWRNGHNIKRGEAAAGRETSVEDRSLNGAAVENSDGRAPNSSVLQQALEGKLSTGFSDTCHQSKISINNTSQWASQIICQAALISGLGGEGYTPAQRQDFSQNIKNSGLSPNTTDRVFDGNKENSQKQLDWENENGALEILNEVLDGAKSSSQDGPQMAESSHLNLTSEVTPEDMIKYMVVIEAGLLSAARFLAGRFAIKEAVIKAHRHRRLTYQDVSIQRPESNKFGTRAPVAVVIPEDGDMENGQEALISMSHDGDYAMATCMAFDPS